MKSSENLNALASQLAIDAQYYEQKAHECWELLTGIDNYYIETKGRPAELNFTVGMGSRALQHLPVHLSDITVINNMLMELMRYYRSRYAKAQERLNSLKLAS